MRSMTAELKLDMRSMTADMRSMTADLENDIANGSLKSNHPEQAEKMNSAVLTAQKKASERDMQVARAMLGK